MANAVFVLNLNTYAKGVAVGAKIAGLRDRRANAPQAVRICHSVSIDAAVVNFVAHSVKHTSIDAIAGKVAERLGMIEHFASAIKVLFDFGPLRKVLYVGNWNLQVIG